MAADMAVSVTIGAILGQTYRKVFQDAKSRLQQIGQEHKETQKKLRAVGGLIKYQKEIDTLRAKQGDLTAAEKRALAAAQKRFQQAGKAAKSYGLEVGKAAEQHKKLVGRIGSLDRERRAIEGKERHGREMGALRGRLMGAAGVAYGVGRMVGDAMEREEQAQYLRTVINAPDKDAAVGRALDHAREVYPRECGGTTSYGLMPDGQHGLSPRVRGNLRSSRISTRPTRSIPASAGEPSRRGRAPTSWRVYPRECGGTGPPARTCFQAAGLSPRVRGNPPDVSGRAHGGGSIPASAGEPAARSSRPRPTAVYPRECGGTFTPGESPDLVEGLSPRVRGNPREEGRPPRL